MGDNDCSLPSIFKREGPTLRSRYQVSRCMESVTLLDIGAAGAEVCTIAGGELFCVATVDGIVLF